MCVVGVFVFWVCMCVVFVFVLCVWGWVRVFVCVFDDFVCGGVPCAWCGCSWCVSECGVVCVVWCVWCVFL